MSLLFSTGVIAASGLAKGAPGMVLVKPTSIANTAGSASIGTNGQVTFTTCEVLSLNGVFSATYDNYVIALSGLSSLNDNISARLRASGSDASGSNYTRQFTGANSTTVEASRSTSLTQAVFGLFDTVNTNLVHVTIYAPFLTQPTVWRTTGAGTTAGAYLRDEANSHSLSTSYDGFTIYNAGSPARTITGTISVYGLRS